MMLRMAFRWIIQHLDRGIREITEFCHRNHYKLEKIYTDQQTGKNFNRPRYIVLRDDILREGDTLIITEVDRLGRNKKDTVEELRILANRNIRVMILEIPTTLQDISKMDNSMARMILETVNHMLIELYAAMAPELFFRFYIDANIPPEKGWEQEKIEKSVYEKYLKSTFSGKYSYLMEDFEELLGLIFSSQRTLKMASIFYGKSNTGKTVALNMIANLIAHEFVSYVSFSQFSEEFAVANLAGKAVNISGEISGINGLGVVDSWERVTETRKYLYRLKVRKCDTFKEAEAKAIRE